jgi:glycyl-tRNA synthetase beta chain
MTETLLVEIFTEELPPKALKRLGEAFSERVMVELRSRDFLMDTSASWSYATPRRLAVVITDVLSEARDQTLERNLPPVDKSIDAEGNPTPTLQKALSKFGLDFVAVHDLERRLDGKTERFFYRQLVPGPPLIASLESALQEAVESLPIPKVMRYQTSAGKDVEFVRPAHSLVALHGSDVVPVRVLELQAGRITHGHRFQGAQDIELGHADEYEDRLCDQGGVIASFTKRRAEIERQLQEKAAALGADPRLTERDALLDEVTALVEMPTVYVGEFEREYLEVPQECLILTMQQNQKYFPLFDASGRLTNKFLIVSNMRLADPKNIVTGNERVVRPRLADARFFFEQDKKIKLADRVPQLAGIVYHNKLGSQLQRVERLQILAAQIAHMLRGAGYAADEQQVARAAWLCKADLTTHMVGEFPELQGIMGTYYARHDGEAEPVSLAIEAHYHPRFAGDTLPGNMVGTCVAVADRLDTLVGIFGAGQAPTGDKDPHGLRRAALGVLRILIEKELSLDLDNLLSAAASGLQGLIADGATASVYEFMLERLKGYLRERGFEFNEIEAVLSQRPTRIDLVVPRLTAVRAFRSLPEAESLSAANKRTRNILRKADGVVGEGCNPALFAEGAETRLHASVTRLGPEVDTRVAAQDYAGALQQLAGIRGDVDKFFDDVLVMADDPKVRANRLALLAELERLMNQVADISKLAA